MITPYYDDGNGIQIYLGDCRLILPQLDVKVDLVLTDPPYGVGIDNSFNDDFGQTDNLNLIKNVGLVCFTSPRRVAGLIKRLDATFEGIFLYHKINDIAYPWHGFAMNSEAITIFKNGDYKWCKSEVYGSDLLQFVNNDGFHPCSKPIALIKLLLRHFSEPNTLILDPFLGSGTTAVAAKILGRKCIGIEIEEKYCKIAVERLRQSVMRLDV